MSVIKCFNRECHYWDAGDMDHCSHPYIEISKCFHGVIRKEGGKAKNFYFEELRSNECQCGEPKRPYHSFCFGCYRSLPQDFQRDLYRRIGHGYEEAYEAAIKHLNE